MTGDALPRATGEARQAESGGALMARQARIIGSADDIWGGVWDVREARQIGGGQAVLLGWPHGAPRGKGGAGGQRVIVTAVLAAALEPYRDAPMPTGWPIGETAIKRVRRLLGHGWRIGRTQWWDDRLLDLLTLSLTEFARRHNVSVAAASLAHKETFGPINRPAGWWREPQVAALILSDWPVAHVADRLGCSAGAIRRLRWMLRTNGDAA